MEQGLQVLTGLGFPSRMAETPQQVRTPTCPPAQTLMELTCPAGNLTTKEGNKRSVPKGNCLGSAAGLFDLTGCLAHLESVWKEKSGTSSEVWAPLLRAPYPLPEQFLFSSKHCYEGILFYWGLAEY